jgi:cation diffusion facilitator CzcD-associated flavoprotein CzcO
MSQKETEPSSHADPHTFDVIVIGAGFAGVGVAIQLQEAGFDFLVLEKAAEAGGVWRENTYPDCACDVPSALYSYSFAPNPDWSRIFAGQAEIKDYLQSVAERYAILDSVRFNHELINAVWVESLKCWQLETSGGSYSARFVVMASGPMHKPIVPALPGLESFSGETFHSAAWNHDVDLTGKRVAVVGSGASAIQMVPAIQPLVKELTLFQRTPHWVLPKMDSRIPSKWQRIFRRVPFTQKLLRAFYYVQFEILNGSFRSVALMKKLQRVALSNIQKTVKDPELEARLTPDYVIGCKRILQSNHWYRALVKPNVKVLGGVVGVEGNSVVSTDGQRADVDVIIFATGFQIADPPIAERIVGVSGVPLSETWGGSPQAYRGTMAIDCPNCFLMFGPNLAIASSAFIIIEAQIKYIMSALKQARKRGVSTISIDPAKTDAYNEKVQSALQNTVWNVGGCTSYFLDAHGRNSTAWPWSTLTMRRKLTTFPLQHHLTE